MKRFEVIDASCDGGPKYLVDTPDYGVNLYDGRSFQAALEVVEALEAKQLWRAVAVSETQTIVYVTTGDHAASSAVNMITFGRLTMKNLFMETLVHDLQTKLYKAIALYAANGR